MEDCSRDLNDLVYGKAKEKRGNNDDNIYTCVSMLNPPQHFLPVGCYWNEQKRFQSGELIALLDFSPFCKLTSLSK